MTNKSLLTLPLLAGSAAAHAGVEGALDGAAMSGMLLIGVTAVAALWLAARERRRESGKPAPVRLRVKARRFSQP